VHRVVCAIDCGTAINPNIIAQQMEALSVLALTAALYGPHRCPRRQGAAGELPFLSHGPTGCDAAGGNLDREQRAASGWRRRARACRRWHPQWPMGCFALNGRRYRSLPLAG
jgi:isoquinoline 1-oxidoreductase beta subunit